MGFGGYYLLITKPVQNLIGKKVLSGISSRTGTEFSASYVNFSKFRKLEIRDLFIADQNNDTLLYASKALVVLDSINFSAHFASVESILVKSPTINISQNDSGMFNYSFIVDSLSNSEMPDSSKWKIDFHDIDINEGNLSLALLSADEMRFDDLNLSVNIQDQKIQLEEFDFDLNNEFSLEKSYAEVLLSPEGIKVPELSLSSKTSALILKDISITSNWPTLKESPPEDLKFHLQSNNSYISGSDISCFFPIVKTLNHSVVIDGVVDGDLALLNGQDLHISIDSLVSATSKFEIKNINDFDKLSYDFDFEQLLINVVGLSNAYEQVFPDNSIDLNAYRHWGGVGLSGSVIGDKSSFTTVSSISSRYGEVDVDAYVYLGDSLKGLSYTGDIGTQDFQIGEASKNTALLGTVSAKLFTTGAINSNGKFNNYFKGDISSVKIKDYTYTNITLKGDVAQGYFNGKLAVEDENANFDFSGEVDFLSKEPAFNFTLDMEHLALAKLGLSDAYQQLDVSFNLNSKLTGNSVDNVNGFLNIDSLLLETEFQSFTSSNINLGFKPLDAVPSIVISSEYVNGLIFGSYNFSELLGYLNTSLKKHLKYLPQKFSVPTGETQNEFDFIFEVEDMQPLAITLDLPLRANGFTIISGMVNSKFNTFTLESEIPYILTKGQVLDSINISIENNDLDFISKINIGSLTYGEGHSMDNVQINNSIKEDTIQLSTTWINSNSDVDGGDFKGKVWLEPYGRDFKTIIESQPSDFYVSNALWKLNKHQISILPQHITIDSLVLNNENGSFLLDGIASKDLSDTMRLEMDEFELSNLDRFLNINNFNFGGLLSGSVELYSLLDKPVFVTDVTIDSTVVNSSLWGDISAVTTWNAETSSLDIHAKSNSRTEGEELLFIDGIYYQVEDSLDLIGQFNGFDIGFIYPYLEPTMYELRGVASGLLDVKGSIKDPELYGALGVQNGGFRIDYLSTDFFLNDSIKFDKNRFVFDKTTVTDQEGNEAIVTGDVVHTRYKNMLVDLAIESDRFLGLNTTAMENEYFYGDVFFGGVITIKSTNAETRIGSRAVTEKGSFLTVPLSPVSTAASNNFINYIVKQKDTLSLTDKPRLVIQPNIPAKPLIIDMNFDVTSSMALRLEFDTKSGDVIEATGNGNLNIQFQKGHPFQMFGEYEIVKGNYNFTFEQIFNKKFNVVAGSSLRWSGRPGNAIVDITALYPTRASLYNLMPDAISESNKNRRVPVDVKMLLEERLSQPNISFDIELPNTDAETQQSVSSIINTEEEMSRQVLSLLIVNSFYTPEYYTNSTAQSTSQLSNAAAVTASELLSNQLSNWMSQISDNFDLGFNYTPEQELSDEGLTPEEYQMAISTQFFNDRLTVNTNVGYQAYTEENSPTNMNSNFVGEVDVELKLNQHLKLKAYSHQNDDIYYESSSMKQGAAFTYQEDFTTLKELSERYKQRLGKLFNRKEKKNEEAIIKEDDEDFIEDVDDEVNFEE